MKLPLTKVITIVLSYLKLMLINVNDFLIKKIIVPTYVCMYVCVIKVHV
jgi:hypothetical protein